MNKKSLQVMMKLRHLNQSDLSHLAGVSRQAVSLWFKSKDSYINIQTRNVYQFCSNANISPDVIMESPFDALEKDQSIKENLTTEFIWDQSFSDLETFFIQLVEGNLQALGRFVQVIGPLTSWKLLGDVVYKSFDQYKKYLHPKIRERHLVLWKNLIQMKLISPH